MPIRDRVSMACSTSGGSEMFSMTNVGTAMPTGLSSSVSTAASRVPIAFCCVARSSIGTPEVASALDSRPTINCRRYSCTSSVRNCGSVPASSRSSAAASTTRAANEPNARSRTIPNSASRTMTGFAVPHFMSVNCRVVTKYTSALNGESKPYFQPLRVDRIGMFWVWRVYVPGVNTSAIWPSLTNTAVWDSRTTSLAPILISLSWRGKRHTMVSRLSSVHSTMSMNSPRIASSRPTSDPSSALPRPCACVLEPAHSTAGGRRPAGRRGGEPDRTGPGAPRARTRVRDGPVPAGAGPRGIGPRIGMPSGPAGRRRQAVASGA